MVIELPLREFTQLQISKELNISNRDVNKIINNSKEKMHGFGEKSPTAKAFEMFSDGEFPVDVVKSLDIPHIEAEKLYSDDLRLDGRQTVNLFFNEIKDKLSDFGNMYIMIKKYHTDDSLKIRLIRINDPDLINTKLKSKNE